VPHFVPRSTAHFYLEILKILQFHEISSRPLMFVPRQQHGHAVH
jgi:hypothetical protein